MKICVYGASSNAIDPCYIQAGEELGKILGEHGHTLIYGGGATGLMGAVSRGMFEKNGKVIGVSPKFFDIDGILEKRCTQMVLTETMRERKDYMEQAADAFIVTPGGIGTFEEFFETCTLRQLGQLPKPIAFLNTNGYYDPMMQLLYFTAEKGFVAKDLVDQLIVCQTPEETVFQLEKIMEQGETLLSLEEHCQNVLKEEWK